MGGAMSELPPINLPEILKKYGDKTAVYKPLRFLLYTACLEPTENEFPCMVFPWGMDAGDVLRIIP